MAGSYGHIVDDYGRLLGNRAFCDMIENLGDAYEMAEELYGMIWYLAKGDPYVVAQARENWELGLQWAPAGLD